MRLATDLPKAKGRARGLMAAVGTCLLFVLLASSPCKAEPARRALDLELDDVAGMKGYEIKVTRVLVGAQKKDPVFFKIQGHNWSAKLLPGKYAIEVRSYDFRNVPGAWSPAQEVVVKLNAAELTEPADKADIKSENPDEEKLALNWKPVEGAELYKVRLMKADGSLVQETFEKETSVKVKVAVAQAYHWTVTPVMESTIEGDTSNAYEFNVVGGPLPKISFLPIDDINTAELAWAGVAFAKQYEFNLERLDESGQWKPFDHRLVNGDKRVFSKPLPTGRYRVKVLAKGEDRADSEYVSNEFKTLYVNTRSPAAIEQVKSETSYDTKSTIFGLASYTVTVLNYSGTNNDLQSKPYPVNFNSIGGTGRVGIGTWFKEDSKIGLLAVADLSGVEVAGQTQTYFAGSLQGVYRERIGALGQLRFNAGVESRDLPVTIANTNYINNTGNLSGSGSTYQDKISNLGPVAGVALLHGFSRKFGMQINAQVFDSLSGTHTPNGQGNVSQISYQAGLLGSLSLASKLVGFAGYTYRSENAAYGSNGGANDAVSLTGQYVNFTLEYGF